MEVVMSSDKFKEDLIFSIYKDKALRGARTFKSMIKEKYKVDASSDLYAKLVNYQLNVYGKYLTPNDMDYIKDFRHKNNRKRRINSESSSERYRLYKFIERNTK